MKVQVNGKLIKELRTRHSYSQERLAEIAGVNLRTIQRIESRGVASLKTRGALAEALGVRPDQLDFRASRVTNQSAEAVGHWPRWSLVAVSAGLAVFAIAIFSIIINDFQGIELLSGDPGAVPPFAAQAVEPVADAPASAEPAASRR